MSTTAARIILLTNYLHIIFNEAIFEYTCKTLYERYLSNTPINIGDSYVLQVCNLVYNSYLLVQNLEDGIRVLDAPRNLCTYDCILV